MRIAALEPIPVALPFREPYRTARGVLHDRAMAVVRLRGEDGSVGYGEAVPLSLRGGPSLQHICRDLTDLCEPALLEAPAELSEIGDEGEARAWASGLLEACRRRGAGAQALAAVDVALHDLAGRAAALPMWRLLGADGRRPIACNASIDARDPEDAADLAAAARETGFATFKVKVGTARDEDLARVAAIREAVGERGLIRIDANGVWSPVRAEAILAELAPLGIELAEQPCASLPELIALRAAVEVPIVADETATSVRDALEALQAGACDAVTAKLAKMGGPLEVLRVAELVPTYLSSALDGPIGIAAAVHAAQALPTAGPAAGFAHGLATLTMFADTYAPIEDLYGPELIAPDSPGLGIEIDETALEALRIR